VERPGGGGGAAACGTSVPTNTPLLLMLENRRRRVGVERAGGEIVLGEGGGAGRCRANSSTPAVKPHHAGVARIDWSWTLSSASASKRNSRATTPRAGFSVPRGRRRADVCKSRLTDRAFPYAPATGMNVLLARAASVDCDEISPTYAGADPVGACVEPLSQLEIDRLLEMTDRLHASTDVGGFAAVATAILPALVPCDIVAYNEIDPRRRRFQFVSDPVDAALPGAAAAFIRHMDDNPLLVHTDAVRRMGSCG